MEINRTMKVVGTVAAAVFASSRLEEMAFYKDMPEGTQKHLLYYAIPGGVAYGLAHYFMKESVSPWKMMAAVAAGLFITDKVQASAFYGNLTPGWEQQAVDYGLPGAVVYAAEHFKVL